MRCASCHGRQSELLARIKVCKLDPPRTGFHGSWTLLNQNILVTDLRHGSTIGRLLDSTYLGLYVAVCIAFSMHSRQALKYLDGNLASVIFE